MTRAALEKCELCPLHERSGRIRTINGIRQPPKDRNRYTSVFKILHTTKPRTPRWHTMHTRPSHAPPEARVPGEVHNGHRLAPLDIRLALRAHSPLTIKRAQGDPATHPPHLVYCHRGHRLRHLAAAQLHTTTGTRRSQGAASTKTRFRTRSPTRLTICTTRTHTAAAAA